MRAGADATFSIAFDRRIVEQSQDRIANIDLVGKPVFGKTKIDGNIRQDARANPIEIGIKLFEHGAEFGHAFRPDICQHLACKRMIDRHRATDMPEFLQIMMICTLGDLGLEWGISALPGNCRIIATSLFRFGQFE